MLKRARLLWYYGVGVAGLRRDDVLLASFPKSGNTWVRFFFCNLIEVLAGRPEPVDHATLDRVMPELGSSNLLARWPHTSVPRVVKTHKARWALFSGRRSVLLTRDPRDVMASFYHFERGKRRARFTGGFDALLRHRRFGLRAWFEHTASWLDQDSHWITYEKLKQDDIGTFSGLLDFLAIDASEHAVREAAARSSFETVRALEDKRRHKPDKYREGFRFARSGERGGWRDLFSDDDLRYYTELKDSYGLSAY